LHVFSENLLVPCAYPNPMPSLAQFHLPVPSLPSHYRPHIIYAFCAALHSILLQAEPGIQRAGVEGERWALMQRTAGTGQTPGGDWFTAAADMGLAESTWARFSRLDGGEDKSSLLEAYGALGDKFGQSVTVQPPQCLITVQHTQHLWLCNLRLVAQVQRSRHYLTLSFVGQASRCTDGRSCELPSGPAGLAVYLNRVC